MFITSSGRRIELAEAGRAFSKIEAAKRKSQITADM